MAKLRSTSRTRSRTPSPRPDKAMKAQAMEGRAEYASTFLALLAHIDDEVARMNPTPLHGFFMPPCQSKEDNTIFRPRPFQAVLHDDLSSEDVANVMLQVATWRKERHQSKRDKFREAALASMIRRSAEDTTKSTKEPFTATRGRIAPTLVAMDRFKENMAPHREAIMSSFQQIEEKALTALGSIRDKRVESKPRDVPEAVLAVETIDVPEAGATEKSTETDEVDLVEFLRAFWMEDEVYHRRLSVSEIDIPGCLELR